MKTKLKLRTKLYAAFGLLLALMAALGVLAAVSLHNAEQNTRTVGKDGFAAETSLATVGQVMNKLRKDQIHYMVVGPDSRQGVRDDVSGDLADMKTAFAS